MKVLRGLLEMLCRTERHAVEDCKFARLTGPGRVLTIIAASLLFDGFSAPDVLCFGGHLISL